MALQSSPDGSDPKILSTKKDLAAWDAEIPPFDKDFMFDVVKIERDIQRKSANVYKIISNMSGSVIIYDFNEPHSILNPKLP